MIEMSKFAWDTGIGSEDWRQYFRQPVSVPSVSETTPHTPFKADELSSSKPYSVSNPPSSPSSKVNHIPKYQLSTFLDNSLDIEDDLRHVAAIIEEVSRKNTSQKKKKQEIPLTPSRHRISFSEGVPTAAARNTLKLETPVRAFTATPYRIGSRHSSNPDTVSFEYNSVVDMLPSVPVPMEAPTDVVIPPINIPFLNEAVTSAGFLHNNTNEESIHTLKRDYKSIETGELRRGEKGNTRTENILHSPAVKQLASLLPSTTPSRAPLMDLPENMNSSTNNISSMKFPGRRLTEPEPKSVPVKKSFLEENGISIKSGIGKVSVARAKEPLLDHLKNIPSRVSSTPKSQNVPNSKLSSKNSGTSITFQPNSQEKETKLSVPKIIVAKSVLSQGKPKPPPVVPSPVQKLSFSLTRVVPPASSLSDRQRQISSSPTTSVFELKQVQKKQEVVNTDVVVPDKILDHSTRSMDTISNVSAISSHGDELSAMNHYVDSTNIDSTNLYVSGSELSSPFSDTGGLSSTQTQIPDGSTDGGELLVDAQSSSMNAPSLEHVLTSKIDSLMELMDRADEIIVASETSRANLSFSDMPEFMKSSDRAVRNEEENVNEDCKTEVQLHSDNGVSCSSQMASATTSLMAEVTEQLNDVLEEKNSTGDSMQMNSSIIQKGNSRSSSLKNVIFSSVPTVFASKNDSPSLVDNLAINSSFQKGCEHEREEGNMKLAESLNSTLIDAKVDDEAVETCNNTSSDKKYSPLTSVSELKSFGPTSYLSPNLVKRFGEIEEPSVSSSPLKGEMPMNHSSLADTIPSKVERRFSFDNSISNISAILPASHSYSFSSSTSNLESSIPLDNSCLSETKCVDKRNESGKVLQSPSVSIEADSLLEIDAKECDSSLDATLENAAAPEQLHFQQSQRRGALPSITITPKSFSSLKNDVPLEQNLISSHRLVPITTDIVESSIAPTPLIAPTSSLVMKTNTVERTFEGKEAEDDVKVDNESLPVSNTTTPPAPGAKTECSKNCRSSPTSKITDKSFIPESSPSSQLQQKLSESEGSSPMSGNLLTQLQQYRESQRLKMLSRQAATADIPLQNAPVFPTTVVPTSNENNSIPIPDSSSPMKMPMRVVSPMQAAFVETQLSIDEEPSTAEDVTALSSIRIDSSTCSDDELQRSSIESCDEIIQDDEFPDGVSNYEREIVDLVDSQPNPISEFITENSTTMEPVSTSQTSVDAPSFLPKSLIASFASVPMSSTRNVVILNDPSADNTPIESLSQADIRSSAIFVPSESQFSDSAPHSSVSVVDADQVRELKEERNPVVPADRIPAVSSTTQSMSVQRRESLSTFPPASPPPSSTPISTIRSVSRSLPSPPITTTASSPLPSTVRSVSPSKDSVLSSIMQSAPVARMRSPPAGGAVILNPARYSDSDDEVDGDESYSSGPIPGTSHGAGVPRVATLGRQRGGLFSMNMSVDESFDLEFAVPVTNSTLVASLPTSTNLAARVERDKEEYTNPIEALIRRNLKSAPSAFGSMGIPPSSSLLQAPSGSRDIGTGSSSLSTEYLPLSPAAASAGTSVIPPTSPFPVLRSLKRVSKSTPGKRNQKVDMHASATVNQYSSSMPRSTSNLRSVSASRSNHNTPLSPTAPVKELTFDSPNAKGQSARLSKRSTIYF